MTVVTGESPQYSKEYCVNVLQNICMLLAELFMSYGHSLLYVKSQNFPMWLCLKANMAVHYYHNGPFRAPEACFSMLPYCNS